MYKKDKPNPIEAGANAARGCFDGDGLTTMYARFCGAVMGLLAGCRLYGNEYTIAALNALVDEFNRIRRIRRRKRTAVNAMPYRDYQQADPVEVCDSCGRDLYPGDEYVTMLGGKVLCEQCWEEEDNG